MSFSPGSSAPHRQRGSARLTRRQFLGALFGAVVAGSLGYARFYELHRLEIVRRDLPVPGLPSDLEGRILVQLSDLHVGPRA